MKRKYLLLFLPLLFFLFFFPEESLLASCEGVRLWFHTVLPALLPFLILSNILVRSGLILPLLSHLEPFTGPDLRRSLLPGSGGTVRFSHGRQTVG